MAGLKRKSNFDVPPEEAPPQAQALLSVLLQKAQEAARSHQIGEVPIRSLVDEVGSWGNHGSE